MARGIDNRNVSFVINMYPPRTSNNEDESELDIETFVHRIARTGRFKDKGVALTLL